MKQLKDWTLEEIQEYCTDAYCTERELKSFCDENFCANHGGNTSPANRTPYDWDLTPATPTHTVGEIVWHPYPLEIPPKEGKYLVTTSTNFISTAKWITSPNYTFVIPVEVIARAEHPKPYKEKEG